MSVNVAVVGVGRMGRRHLQALQTADATVVAIADVDEASLAEAAALAPAARSYRAWESMLRDEPIDLLCVATTSPAHDPIVCAAAAVVPRIFCEKPLATSLAAGRRMIDACRRGGTRFVVNHSRRLFGPYLRIQAALTEGAFGDVRSMRVTCGASGLSNIGTHAFDLMRWFCGPAVAVTGYVDKTPHQNPRGARFYDPGGHGLVVFAEGRRATFDFTADFPAEFVVDLVCRHGHIRVREHVREVQAVSRSSDDGLASVNDYGPATVAVPIEFGGDVDLVAMTAAMIRHVISDEPSVCDGQDALSALEMAAAVHVSDANGHGPVTLPLLDDRGSLERIA